jgi:broad specificity phosphatase PhoE
MSECLAERLASYGPSVISCSREPKAVETAEIVARAFAVPVRPVDGLEEHHRENVPFLSPSEFEESVRQLFSRPDRLVLGTETARQALDRFTVAVDGLIESQQSDSIVVTHRTVMTLYVADVAGVEPMCFWTRLRLPSFVALTVPDLRIDSIVDSV